MLVVHSELKRPADVEAALALSLIHISVESVLRIAAQLVSRKGVKVLVVDPFNRFEHQIPDWETETQYISRIFDEFSNFAVKHKVLLILVAHPTKLRREPGSKRWPVPTLYDICLLYTSDSSTGTFHSDESGRDGGRG